MIILALWIVAVVVGTSVGSAKGHGAAGFFLSLLLAWFGVVIVLLLPRRPRTINVNLKSELPPPPPSFTADERAYYKAHTPKGK